MTIQMFFDDDSAVVRRRFRRFFIHFMGKYSPPCIFFLIMGDYKQTFDLTLKTQLRHHEDIF